MSGYSGNVGDSLNYEGTGNFGAPTQRHNGMKFTTFDQDNDNGYGFNCVSITGGAWWFNQCMWSCLTCDEAYYEWGTMPSKYVVNSRMMIKPQ